MCHHKVSGQHQSVHQVSSVRNLQDDPPKPSNEDVYIEHTPAFTAYVISYGGWQTKDKFLEHATQLYSTLEEKGIDVREDMYYTAGYDSPFRLLNRHNEVRFRTWMLQRRMPKCNTRYSHLTQDAHVL